MLARKKTHKHLVGPLKWITVIRISLSRTTSDRAVIVEMRRVIMRSQGNRLPAGT